MIHRCMVAVVLIVFAFIAPNGYAEGEKAALTTTDDDQAIKAVALDYIQGWYTGDAARMESALHPELAKRINVKNANGGYRLGQQSAMTLVQATRNGGGRSEKNPRSEVKILDRFEGAASVRVDASTWIDYLHLVKVDGRWKIVNVLWELRPS